MVKEKVTQPRQVAVAIPYCHDGSGSVRVCLVTSRKHDGRYVLPKGGVEKGETGWQAAVREMWEEAGLRPWASSSSPSTTALSSILDHKPHKHSPSSDSNAVDFVARAEYAAFAVPVRQGDDACELAHWPEEHERKRAWFTYEGACRETAWRKDLHQLLVRAEAQLSRSTA